MRTTIAVEIECTENSCILRQEVCISAGQGKSCYRSFFATHHVPDLIVLHFCGAVPRAKDSTPHTLGPALIFPPARACSFPGQILFHHSLPQWLLLQLLIILTNYAPTTGQQCENTVSSKSVGFGVRPSAWHDAWHAVGIR